MSFIFDLILIVVAAAAVYRGISKGFIKSAMHFASLILAIVCVFIFTAPVAAWLEDGFIKNGVSQITKESLDSIVNAGTEQFDIDEVLADRPESLSEFADRFDFDIGDIEEYYNEFLANLTRSDALEALSEKIAAPTASALSTVAAAVIIFVAVLIVCAIVTYVLDLLCRLPVLKQLNKLLGALFGVASAFVSAWAIANICVGLVYALNTIRGDIFNEAAITGSFILKLFVDFGLILF